MISANDSQGEQGPHASLPLFPLQQEQSKKAAEELPLFHPNETNTILKQTANSLYATTELGHGRLLNDPSLSAANTQHELRLSTGNPLSLIQNDHRDIHRSSTACNNDYQMMCNTDMPSLSCTSTPRERPINHQTTAPKTVSPPSCHAAIKAPVGTFGSLPWSPASTVDLSGADNGVRNSMALLSSLAHAALPIFSEAKYEVIELREPVDRKANSTSRCQPLPLHNMYGDDLVSTPQLPTNGMVSLLQMHQLNGLKGDSSDDHGSNYASIGGMDELKKKPTGSGSMRRNRLLRASCSSNGSPSSWLYGFESSLTSFRIRNEGLGTKPVLSPNRRPTGLLLAPTPTVTRAGSFRNKSPGDVSSNNNNTYTKQEEEDHPLSSVKINIRRKAQRQQFHPFDSVGSGFAPAPSYPLEDSLDSLVPFEEDGDDSHLEDQCEVDSLCSLEEEPDAHVDEFYASLSPSTSQESSIYQRPALSYKDENPMARAPSFDFGLGQSNIYRRRRSANDRKTYASASQRANIKRELTCRSTESASAPMGVRGVQGSPMASDSSNALLFGIQRRRSSTTLDRTRTVQSIRGIRSSISVTSHYGYLSGDLAPTAASAMPTTAAALALLGDWGAQRPAK